MSEQKNPKGREMSVAEFHKCKDSQNQTEATVKGVRFGLHEVANWISKYRSIGNELAIRDVVVDGQASKAMVISNDMGDIVTAFEFGTPCPPFCNNTITGLE